VDARFVAFCQLERHHLFPRAYPRTLEIDAAIDVNQIANLAIAGWEVNGQIPDEAPSDYWPVWVQKYGKGADDLADMQFWHALPDRWQDLDCHQFLAVRRQLMAKVIRAWFKRLSGLASTTGSTRRDTQSTLTKRFSSRRCGAPGRTTSVRRVRRAAPRRKKWLQGIALMRKTCTVNRRIFSVEAKKKLLRPCREARALGR
jgi:hypothetical protein